MCTQSSNSGSDPASLTNKRGTYQRTNHHNHSKEATTTMRKGNPFFEDERIVALLQELDSITTRRHFRRWKKSFLEAFEVYLDESGSIKVRSSYRELCHILSRHVELVKKMHAHIQCGDLSPEGCTVRSRQTLVNFFDQMIRVKQILIDLLPTTAGMEKRIGYTKFHLAAVLIDNGFIAYDRLSLCDEIHCHFKKWCLQDVANKLFLLEMDHYHNQLVMFCDILADLGLKGTAQKCLKFLHLDDEETIIWEGEDDDVSDDGSLWSESDQVDLDPLPDLSDITFEDDDSLNLPLWKVNNFYRDNAEKAEAFRHDMKRKSFEMFNDNVCHTSGGGKPPSMPRRSRDTSPPPPPAPTKPRRRLSNEGSNPEREASETADPPPPPTKPQRRLSIEASAPVVGSITTTSENSSENAQSCSKAPKSQASGRVAEMDDTKRTGNRTSRFSSRTMDTEDLSDSDESVESHAKEPSDCAATNDNSKPKAAQEDRRDSLERQGTRRFVAPPTNYFAIPTSKLSHIKPKLDEQEEEESEEPQPRELSNRRDADERQTSFYSFANYYHGSPSDWRIKKTEQ